MTDRSNGQPTTPWFGSSPESRGSCGSDAGRHPWRSMFRIRRRNLSWPAEASSRPRLRWRSTTGSSSRRISEIWETCARCASSSRRLVGCSRCSVSPRGIIVHDAHPDFTSTRWTSRQGLHSVADPASPRACLRAGGGTRQKTRRCWCSHGTVWDSARTETLWGGETLLGSPGAWRRVGTFRPLRLVGGDRVALEPWRSACSVCWEIGIDWGRHRPEFADIRRAWEARSGTQQTSAVGRLFDAAAALLGLAEVASYDGHAPALVECAADAAAADARRFRCLTMADIRTIDWAPLVPGAAGGGNTGAANARRLSTRRWRRRSWPRRDIGARSTGPISVGLTGGVFQNRLLTERAAASAGIRRFRVLLHERVPPNDGGLSFGQAVEFAARNTAA